MHPIRLRKGLWPLAAGIIAVACLGLATSCSTRGEAGGETHNGQPVKGGVLRLVQLAPRSLDPAEAHSIYESLPLNQIFDGLVSIDPSLNVVPGLASTWTLSRDGRVYIFRLRPDARFHDGHPLTAEDVVFTIRRLLSPRKEWRTVARSPLGVLEGAREFMAGERGELPGIEALDDHTVCIRLERPFSSFLDVLAMDGLNIVPRHVVESVGDEAFGRQPVGSGPFRLATWNEDHLYLEANVDYRIGAPYLEGVDISFVQPDEHDSGAGRFYRGEVDVLKVPTAHLERVSSTPGVAVYRYQELSLAFLGLSTITPPLHDVRVRRAIAHAVNRAILSADQPQTRREAQGLLPPGLPAFSPGAKALDHEPDRAARLLAEAGYPGGVGLPPLELYIDIKDEGDAKLIERLTADLWAVGIRLEARTVSWGDLLQHIEARKAPAFRLSWIADIADPDAFLRPLFETGGGANFFDLRDRNIDGLLEDGAQESNPVHRAGIYRWLEQHILNLAPIVPLYHSGGLLAMKREVRGLKPSPLGMAIVRLEKVWLDAPDAPVE